MKAEKVTATAVWIIALAGLVTGGAAGCGNDDASDDTTGATTDDAATTDATPTPVPVEEIEVSDFEGSWEATSYVLTSRDDPSVTIDVIAAGAVFTAETDRAGDLSGQVEVPEALGGPLTLPFAATFTLVDQETMTVTFEPEIPPLLTDFTGPFGLDETSMTLRDDDALFDFGDGAGPVPAIADVTLVRV